MQQPPRIAIVGAGPAGLTAAVIFHRHGWPVTIFEGDASAVSRDQGGMLDLHPEDGQLALQKAGLLDAFLSIARHEDQERRIVDHASGAVVHQEIPAPGEGDRPEIDRIELRLLLLRAVPAAAMRWGARINGVLDHPEGGFCLELQDGLEGPFDLIIGADGAWSRVRAALTAVTPAYSGITFVETWLTDVDERHRESVALVGHGTMFSLHGGCGLIAQRNGGGMIRAYAAFRTRPEDGDRTDVTLSAITKTDLLAHFEQWALPLRNLISNADRIAAVRPIVALPAGLRWPHRPGLTLVGDAAHVMPPLGVGVNLAMLDAAELAEGVVSSDDWRGAVRRYEDVMLARAERSSGQIQDGFAEMFSDEGHAHVTDHLEKQS